MSICIILASFLDASSFTRLFFVREHVQKLRLKFVTKRNQHKRQWDEIQEKERDKKSPVKRAKTSDLPVKEQDIKSEALNTAQPDEDKTKVKEEDKTVDHVDEVKI